MSAFCLDEGGCYRTSVLCTHIHEFLHISHLFHFIYFFVKHISNIWFYVVDIIIGRRTWNCQVRTHIHTKIHTHTHQTKKKKVERARYCYFLLWHTWRKVAHKPNQPIYPSHLSEYATYGLFFRKKMIFGSKIRNSRQPISYCWKINCWKPKFLIGVNRFDSTHNLAVTTARISSETAPMSEPVYDYSDD